MMMCAFVCVNVYVCVVYCTRTRTDIHSDAYMLTLSHMHRLMPTHMHTHMHTHMLTQMRTHICTYRRMHPTLVFLLGETFCMIWE